jgi:transcriptional regulator with XRE-family HTH domain
MNWIEEINTLRAPSQSDASLAADLGVSKQFLSDVLTGKKELSLKLKVMVWKKLGRELGREAALALLPDKVARDLEHAHHELLAGGQVQEALGAKSNFDDWTADLIKLRDDRGLTDAALAAELSVSAAYLSTVLKGKTKLSWKKKIEVWGMRKYDLSRDTLLSFLPADVATELTELDRARGRRRANKLAAAAESRRAK